MWTPIDTNHSSKHCRPNTQPQPHWFPQQDKVSWRAATPQDLLRSCTRNVTKSLKSGLALKFPRSKLCEHPWKVTIHRGLVVHQIWPWPTEKWTWPLRGVPVVSTTRVLAVDPLSPVGCQEGPPWFELVLLCPNELGSGEIELLDLLKLNINKIKELFWTTILQLWMLGQRTSKFYINSSHTCLVSKFIIISPWILELWLKMYLGSQWPSPPVLWDHQNLISSSFSLSKSSVKSLKFFFKDHIHSFSLLKT